MCANNWPLNSLHSLITAASHVCMSTNCTRITGCAGNKILLEGKCKMTCLKRKHGKCLNLLHQTNNCKCKKQIHFYNLYRVFEVWQPMAIAWISRFLFPECICHCSSKAESSPSGVENIPLSWMCSRLGWEGVYAPTSIKHNFSISWINYVLPSVGIRYINGPPLWLYHFLLLG